ncbi:MAG: hypothetical protein H7Y28_02620 [Rhodoferax sp.]|nr:hypothetical protein [Rhodoferax sp.]
MESQTPSVPSDPPASSARGLPTFSHYSQFLRAAMADEESLQLGEGLQIIAGQIEQVAAALREPPADGTAVSHSLMALLDLLREYRHLVQGMGEDWQGSYEFNAHARALTQFRSLVARWASEAGPPRSQPPDGAEFELSAWRLLGAGALLLDAFEQNGPKPVATDADDQNDQDDPSWWGRLMTVLHFKA